MGVGMGTNKFSSCLFIVFFAVACSCDGEHDDVVRIGSIVLPKNVREIDESNGNLEAFPDIAAFPRLEVLLLGSNSLNELIVGRKMPFLVKCYIENNTLTDMRWIDNMPNLVYLNVLGNQLHSIPDISGMKKLKRFSVGDLVSEIVVENSTLENLEIVGTGRIRTFKIKAPLLKRMRISGFEITDFNEMPASRYLEEINVENCIIDSFVGKWKDLPRLGNVYYTIQEEKVQVLLDLEIASIQKKLLDEGRKIRFAPMPVGGGYGSEE